MVFTRKQNIDSKVSTEGEREREREWGKTACKCLCGRALATLACSSYGKMASLERWSISRRFAANQCNAEATVESEATLFSAGSMASQCRNSLHCPY